jgi:hypothetical protein
MSSGERIIKNKSKAALLLYLVYYVVNYGGDLVSLQLQGINENPR